TQTTTEASIPVGNVRQFIHEIDEALKGAETVWDLQEVRRLLTDIRERVRAFFSGLSSSGPASKSEVQKDVERLSAKLKHVEEEEARISTDLDLARAGIMETREATFAAERESVELESKMREV